MTALLRPLMTACLLTSLVALPSTAADGRMQEDTARVRVIHASPDTPSVDVLVNDELALFSSARFGDVTDYAEVPANVYDVKVVPAGAGPDAAAIEADLNLFYGTDYTVVAVETFDSIRPLVLVDDNELPEAGQARVRFLHAVPDAPAVDIKVAGGPFLFQDLTFESVGDYVTVPMDNYTLEVRVAGSDTVVLSVPNVAFLGGSTYTMLATGLLENGSLSTLLAEDNAQAVTVTPMPKLPAIPLTGIDLNALGRRSADSLR